MKSHWWMGNQQGVQAYLFYNTSLKNGVSSYSSEATQSWELLLKGRVEELCEMCAWNSQFVNLSPSRNLLLFPSHFKELYYMIKTLTNENGRMWVCRANDEVSYRPSRKTQCMKCQEQWGKWVPRQVPICKYQNSSSRGPGQICHIFHSNTSRWPSTENTWDTERLRWVELRKCSQSIFALCILSN